MNRLLPALLCRMEVAQRLAISKYHVLTLIREGRLPGYRLGTRLYRVRAEAVMLYLASQKPTTTIPFAPASPTDLATASENAAQVVLPASVSSTTTHEPSPTTVQPLLQCSPELDYNRLPMITLAVPPASTVTVAYLVEEWLADIRTRIRPRTYLSYEQMVKNHMLPVLGQWQADQLNIRTFEKFLQWKRQSDLSALSVQYLRGILRQAYNEAIRWGWLTRNTPALSRGPKAERARVEVMSQEVAQRLLRSLHDLRYEALYITILGLGLRIGEALGLRWADVRLPDDKIPDSLGQLTVQVQLQRIRGACELVPPKSHTSV